ncbi:uncharacterized protein E0L32_008440 [Thyridium curvatum]|uniref:Chromatin modification-related protein n=1 Tax=Thyridium curvatum TaxID=1093900 RepID=A0A507AVP5_9PEZI|nr:uncharacterized protein E0L32_008440 [Thyridium curvatum]TPX10554.1 hypothetical protein E0L32_008440 [Thyridium curvatum]
MKTAKPPAAGTEASSSRRSQPVRQTRTNPPRTTAGLNRSYSRDSLAGGPAHDQPIEIFPAVTHFADAITALPKELVKHFTLLKEVDAKVHLPEQGLFQLVDAALSAPTPDPSRPVNDGASSIAPASAPMSVQNSSTGVPLPPGALIEEQTNPSVFDLSNLPRRQLFRQAAFDIKEMLVALEEKNHVISTANEALHKQLGRIDEVWPFLMDEFSDEAKWGSITHWAYAENRAARASNAQTERSRREGAASLSAAAQAIAEEAAARSDARKQAVAAKRGIKNQQHQDSDFDDHDGKQKGDGAKKSGTSKSRKAPAQSSAATAGPGSHNTNAEPNPAPKRRKVEKTTNGNGPADKALSTVFGNNAAKAKPNSPRSTPAPDGAPKKRKALPTSGNQAKKRNPPATTPSATSSPVIGAFPDKAPVGRASPAPSATGRPASSRARQNSTQSNVDVARQRPSSAASNKPNGNGSILPELAPNGSRAASENKVAKEISAAPKVDEPKPEIEPPAPKPPVNPPNEKKEAPAKVDEVETKKEPTPTVPTAQTVTTKSGRASKPSTPALATFAEASRSRPSRSGENGAAPKRSHKKGASAAAAAQALAAQLADESASSSRQEEDDEEDPLYCYCNGVSYGEMIACDADDCAKEWFHLECVGLKVAPKGNTKWYCEDCKKRLKIGDRKSSVR